VLAKLEKLLVIPAKAGDALQQREALVIQRLYFQGLTSMDSRLRGNDEQETFRK
jgi:hypothetical protein